MNPRHRGLALHQNKAESARGPYFPLGGRRVPSSPEPPSALFSVPQEQTRQPASNGTTTCAKLDNQKSNYETKTDRTRSPGRPSFTRQSAHD